MGRCFHSNTSYFIVWCCFFLAIFINFVYFASFQSQSMQKCYQENRKALRLSMENRRTLMDMVERDLSLGNDNDDKKFSAKKAVNNSQIGRKDEVWINLEAQSDRKHAYVSVNGIKLYEVNDVHDRSRGLHIIVLNQRKGDLMAATVFDFYSGDSNNDLVCFLHSIRQGRIVVFLVKDEASIGFNNTGRKAAMSFGSKLVYNLGFRDHWVCIAKRNSGWLVEDIIKRSGHAFWPGPVKVRVSLKLEEKLGDDEECENDYNGQDYKRKAFCQRYEGYENACDCTIQLYEKPPELINNNLADSPIVIIASNRPRYLYKMLQKLLSVTGAVHRMITVYIDGFHDETIAVAELFGLKVVINHIGCTRNCRIQQHYRNSLSKTFDDFPHAKVAIILEDDLEVSDDIFDYFSQTYPLLESDSSIYCISAWNDQGFLHSVNDPSLLYRVETMPGLGWLLSRSLYKNELEPKWPGNQTYCHWDIWLRKNENRKGRECIIPDISRTYHFGAKGLNTNNNVQNIYYKNRRINVKTEQKFDIETMKKDNYEKELEKLIRNAEILNYTRTDCKEADDIVPDTRGKIYVIFVKMEKNKREKSWLGLAKCFKLWDLEMRDFHNGLIRFWIKENHIIVIGSPESNYAHLRPKNINPIDIR